MALYIFLSKLRIFGHICDRDGQSPSCGQARRRTSSFFGISPQNFPLNQIKSIIKKAGYMTLGARLMKDCYICQYSCIRSWLSV